MGYRFFFSLKNLRNHFLLIPCIAFSNETHNKSYCISVVIISTVDWNITWWTSTTIATVRHRGLPVKESSSSYATRSCLAQSFLYLQAEGLTWKGRSYLVCRVYALCAMTSWNTYFCWMAWTEKVLTCMETAFFLFSVTLPYPYLLSTQSSISRPEALDTQVCNCNGLESNENYRLAEKQHFSEWRCALGDCRCSEGCYLYIYDFFFQGFHLGILCFTILEVSKCLLPASYSSRTGLKLWYQVLQYSMERGRSIAAWSWLGSPSPLTGFTSSLEGAESQVRLLVPQILFSCFQKHQPPESLSAVEEWNLMKVLGQGMINCCYLSSTAKCVCLRVCAIRTVYHLPCPDWKGCMRAWEIKFVTNRTDTDLLAVMTQQIGTHLRHSRAWTWKLVLFFVITWLKKPYGFNLNSKRRKQKPKIPFF